MPQQKTKPAAFTRGQSQPPCCGQIGKWPIIRQFSNDAHQGAAFERFFHRPQRIERARHIEHQQCAPGQAEQFGTRPVNHSALKRGEIGFDPKCGLLVGCTGRQRTGKTDCWTKITPRSGGDLMQTSSCKPAAQRSVDCRNAEGKHGRAEGEADLRPLDLRHFLPEAAQSGYFFNNRAPRTN